MESPSGPLPPGGFSLFGSTYPPKRSGPQGDDPDPPPDGEGWNGKQPDESKGDGRKLKGAPGGGDPSDGGSGGGGPPGSGSGGGRDDGSSTPAPSPSTGSAAGGSADQMAEMLKAFREQQAMMFAVLEKASASSDSKLKVAELFKAPKLPDI